MNLLHEAQSVRLTKSLTLSWGGLTISGEPRLTPSRGGVINEQDVVGALRDYIDSLCIVLEKLAQLRGRVERWLSPQQREFEQKLMLLRQEMVYTRWAR